MNGHSRRVWVLLVGSLLTVTAARTMAASPAPAPAAKPTAGRITFDGQDLTKLPPHRRARLGIARTFQITNLFPTLSVEDNMVLALRGRLEEARKHLQDAVAAQGADPAGWRASATAERIKFAPGLLPTTIRYTNRPSGIQQVITFNGHP